MSDVLVILGVVFFLALPVQTVVLIVKMVRKKPKKRLLISMAAVFAVSMILFIVGVAMSCGHENKEFVENVAATCTEKGYDLYHCPDCGEDIRENFVDAVGHDFVETKRTDSAVEYECLVCGEKKTEVIEPEKEDAAETNIDEQENDKQEAASGEPTELYYGTFYNGDYAAVLEHDESIDADVFNLYEEEGSGYNNIFTGYIYYRDDDGAYEADDEDQYNSFMLTFYEGHIDVYAAYTTERDDLLETGGTYEIGESNAAMIPSGTGAVQYAVQTGLAPEYQNESFQAPTDEVIQRYLDQGYTGVYLTSHEVEYPEDYEKTHDKIGTTDSMQLTVSYSDPDGYFSFKEYKACIYAYWGEELGWNNNYEIYATSGLYDLSGFDDTYWTIEDKERAYSIMDAFFDDFEYNESMEAEICFAFESFDKIQSIGFDNDVYSINQKPLLSWDGEIGTVVAKYEDRVYKASIVKNTTSGADSTVSVKDGYCTVDIAVKGEDVQYGGTNLTILSGKSPGYGMLKRTTKEAYESLSKEGE